MVINNFLNVNNVSKSIKRTDDRLNMLLSNLVIGLSKFKDSYEKALCVLYEKLISFGALSKTSTKTFVLTKTWLSTCLSGQDK